MKTLTLDLSGIYATVPAEAVEAWREKSDQYQHQLHTATGLGNDFLGWINLPNEITDADFSAIEEAARDLQQRCDYVVSIGIGGSYLGARAVIEALTPSFEAYRREHSAPQVIFAGHNIGEDYLSELVDFLQDKRFGLINISKSGTTTEPAIAFRILKALLEKQVGREEARQRIIAVTDKARGALRTLADKEGYKTFIIPDDIGGRFSVLTPVGLLPIAVAGFDIRELVRGAREMKALVDESVPFDQNPAALYAAARNSLYHEGKKIEILGNFHPRLHYIGEWWKQLYGESEGKEHKGIFNAAVDFSADLHSMGQWIQEGERNIFETIISVAEPNSELRIGQDEANLDGLNYLAGKCVDEVNKMAELGVRVAHIDGGVPNIRIVLPKLDAYYIGQLFYFFEKAVGISGYMLEVNPFNQPGVEAYKKNMFALLEKPGFEEETQAIKSRLQ
ncbi:glucose-6-phosphate isomerase [uncultured Porphyromonas sp.]|uniref:glucose-6-phosphate isomerase n=1 Tax=uncultured Porphyromonas sp. TaxID=159274 RepID=UPI00262EC026|nr:glucose-6-phosphate isomerase [uncultured Porphyromonas sp.]